MWAAQLVMIAKPQHLWLQYLAVNYLGLCTSEAELLSETAGTDEPTSTLQVFQGFYFMLAV